jgi:hypothetical protein
MNRPHQDDILIANALRTLAGEVSAELAARPAPAASTIWFRTQRERRRLALDRAMRPLRIMQTLALLCPILIAALLLHQYSASATHLLTPSFLEWAGLAVLAALTGVLAMLHLSRPPSRTPSRP